jgi:hypothetical protein
MYAALVCLAYICTKVYRIMDLASILQEQRPTAKREAEIKKFAEQIVSGEGQEDILQRFRKRETTAQKEQRNRITNTPTPAVISRIRKYFKKVDRVTGVNVKYTNDVIDARVSDMVQDFSGGKSLVEWVNETLERANISDPNAYILYGRSNQSDGTTGTIEAVRVRATLIPSSSVTQAEYQYGQLTKFVHADYRLVSGISVADYYGYELVNGKCVIHEWLNQKGIVDSLGREKKQVGNDAYLYKTYDPDCTRLPLVCVGAYRDDLTDCYVTWFHSAKSALIDLIRDKSFLDVTKTLHTFARRYEYVKACRNEEPNKGECVRGKLDITQETCGACGGTGEGALFTTEQEIVRVSFDNNNVQSLLDLSKLTYTEALNIDLPKFLSEQVESAEKRVIETIFSTGLIQRATSGAATATEKNYEYEDVYDLLRPFALTVAAHWECAVNCYAEYLGIKNWKAQYRYPRDFKLQTSSELIGQFAEAKTNGLGYDIMYILLEQIVQKMNEDDPSEVQRIMNRFDWMPFVGMSDTDVQAVLANRTAIDRDRVLYENFAQIFKRLDAKYEYKFHTLEVAAQEAAISAEIEFVKTYIQTYENGQSNEFSFIE